MNQEERLVKILTYLEINQTMNIKQMCELFNISRDTARRDIVKLTQYNTVIRTHGGVALKSFVRKIENYHDRSETDFEVKKLIGEKANSLISEHEMIYLDVSTTVNAITHYIKSKTCTVVTNSIDTAFSLSNNNQTNIQLLGGILNKVSRHLTGYSTIEKIKDYHFNKVFIGTAGITKNGIYYTFEEDIYFKRELIRHTNQVILLADHSKFNNEQHYRAFSFDNIDTLITSSVPPKDILSELEKYGVELIVTNNPIPN